MNKRANPKRKTRTANHPRRRPMIADTDQAAALPKFLEVKARFDRAHTEGMAALKSRDSTKLGQVIARERRVTGEQSTVIKRVQKKQTRKRRIR